jgi:hypothetical protein
MYKKIIKDRGWWWLRVVGGWRFNNGGSGKKLKSVAPKRESVDIHIIQYIWFIISDMKLFNLAVHTCGAWCKT